MWFICNFKFTSQQIMSGNSILKNGASLHEAYGKDLETLKEGDVIGVMKTSLVSYFLFGNQMNTWIGHVKNYHFF